MDIIIGYLPIIIGLLGCIVGSFLNVVALRQETEKDLGGRSHCPACNHQLAWYELIPVISFLVQRGKCRNCKTVIPARYIINELFVGVLYFLTTSFFIKIYASVYTITSIWFFVALLLLLIIISYVAVMVIYDIQTKLVPLIWFVGLVVFSCIYLTIPYISGAASLVSLWDTVIFHVSGIIIALPFFVLWLISKGRWMGFADIEIIAWMGMFFGIYIGTSAVLISFYIGAVFGILFMIIKLLKGIPYTTIRQTQIPFTPFLFLGWFITVIYMFNMFTLLSGLFL